MSWRTVTLHEWVCDLCGTERTTYDDLEPFGWVHDRSGHDRCPRCTETDCGCDEGTCRVGGARW